MGFKETTQRIMRSGALTKNTIISAPLSLWLGLIMATSSGVYAWAQTQAEIQHIAMAVAGNTESLEFAAEERNIILRELSKREAYFAEIMRAIKELKEDIRNIK